MSGLLSMPARRAVSPPFWLAAAALVPSFLIALPLVYVAVRASDAGLAGIQSELFRPRTGVLLVNTLVLAGGVTTLASLI